jgi:N-acetyl-anhydromuramyl-L-alanine amidase AmpD
MGEVIIGGQSHSIDAPTLTWRESGWQFPNLKHRRHTRCVVWHHTAGEGGGERVYRTLLQRKLSVHFVIERDGRIVQYADTETRCSHAGSANGHSIGVEVVNRADMRPIANGVRRELVREVIHGDERIATTFLAPQIASALALAEVLSDAYHLPMAVPMDGNDVLSTVMSERVADVFIGHTGHLHWSPAKVDPGITLLRAIAAHSARKKAAQDDGVG